jgi:ARC6-like, IMS domain
MKNILVSLIFILLAGCTLPGASTSTSPTSGDPATSAQCVDKPKGTLSLQDVKTIKLTTQPMTETGQVSSGKLMGYSFEAKTGQRFNFKTGDQICVQVYTPSSNVLNGNELSEDGKYIVQISTPQGSTSFSVEMGLDSLLSSAPSNNISQSGKLTKDQALRVIRNWMSSKQKVFAPPWDNTAVNQYTTGPLHNDIVKPEGSIGWLKKYNAYYTFNSYEINNVGAFSASEQRPSIKVQMTEDKTLHTPKGNDPSQSGTSTFTLTYFFALEDGIWKIHDYREEN